MTSSPRLGKFEILERLGEGSAGEVFLARDTILGREVALRIFQGEAMAAPEARERFLREAQAAGRLNHPNLATVHEFGEDRGVHYIATDVAPGRGLAELLDSGEVDRRGILEILAQVCDGLAHAHQRGVLHRELRPGSVRVSRLGNRYNAKILDFGIARLAGIDPAAHPETSAYLAPECLQGGKCDQRVDIFAVGVLLYEALAGERPFGGETAAAVHHCILNEEPAPLDPEALSGISPHAGRIVARAMAKSPAARYATAEAMATELRAARDPAWQGGDAREISVRASQPLLRPAPSGAPSGQRRSGFAIALALLLAAALAAGAWARWRHVRAAKARNAAPTAPVPQPPVQPPPPAEPQQEQPPQAPPSPEPPQPQAAPPPPGARYRSLDEAAAALDADPKGVAAFLEERVKEQPNNERAIALRIAALYGAGDYRGSGIAMMQARQAGHELWPLALKYPPLRKVFEQERQTPRLPRRRQPGEQP